jgi:HD-GYP domain-containing protein (c-di-GMP phosphodiesterase class II)
MMNKAKKKNIVQELEEEFVVLFFRMIQSIRLYQSNSQLLQDYLSGFGKVLEKLIGNEDFTFLVVNNLLCVHGETLRYRRENTRIFNGIVTSFEQRELDGLIFHPEIKEVSPEEILAFMRVLVNAESEENPCKWLEEAKKNNQFNWVDLIPSKEKRKKKEKYDIRERVQTTYRQANAAVKEVSQKIALRNMAGVRKMKRVMHNMVKLAFEDDSILLGASTLCDYDDYTFSHSVNVAILALCLGNYIGLSRKSLGFLSICGLLHDLGKVEVSHEILHKPDKLSTEEWEEIRKHPVSSVKQILMLQASHELKSKIMLGPFEHHLCFDLSGYPKTNFIQQVSLFGRILQIVDVYDAITSPRAYHHDTFSPPEALSYLLEKAGKDFDLTLTKIFISMMGIYPPGTLLHLGTGEIGLVMDYPQKTGSTLPRIILLEEVEGKVKKGEVVDLEEKNTEISLQRRNVLGSFNPDKYGINPADYLL